MAIFLRKNVWWFEYRTKSVRVVRSTGTRDRAKAQALFEAFRVGMGAKPRRSAMEGMLEAIYNEAPVGLPLDAMWGVYLEFLAGKSRKIASHSLVVRRGVMNRFVEWAAERKVVDVRDVSAQVAQEYVRSLCLSNKSKRNYAQILGGVWLGVAALRPGLHNPWAAAAPDPDGSSLRREAFSREQEAAVLEAARKVGHDWYLASMISRWTGLRYGDVANLEWGYAESARNMKHLSCGVVDLARGLIVVDPGKTRRHGVRLVLPIADALAEALRERSKERPMEGFVLPEHAMCYPNRRLGATFADALSLAGLDAVRFTFHSWRHTFRTRLSDAGVADDLARRLGGWANLGMAAHYDHAERLAELLRAVNSAG